MESLFFNIADKRYKKTELLSNHKEYINRIDISNGILFYDIFLTNSKKQLSIKNLDRMLMIALVRKGTLVVDDYIADKSHIVKEGQVTVYCSSRQDITIAMQNSKDTEIFILFIADFFLKRYLSSNKNEPIDFFYNKTQKDISFEEVDILPIDALSLYIVEKLLSVSDNDIMQSIRAEHRVIEFIIHRFSLLDILSEDVNEEELELASRAKAILLKDFIYPPRVKELAHLCASNESKLKKVFKKVYQTTIYSYVQKLRLDKANLLLREENMTIGEISKKVGYKHQGHFSKLFFSTYGVHAKELMR